MPVIKSLTVETITSSGGTFTWDTNSQIQDYFIYGSATMIGNVTISPTGTPALGLTYNIHYRATLDISTTPTTFTVFGLSLTAQQCLTSQEIIATYNGSAWDVSITPSFSNSFVVSTANLANSSVTSVKLAPGAINTSQLADNSVTNAKLHTFAASSLKFGNATGAPNDLPLGDGEIPIGDGTTVTTINKSLLGTEGYLITVPVSFESGEQSINSFYCPENLVIDEARCCVTKTLSGTDSGRITLILNDGALTLSPPLTIAASTSINTELAFAISGGTSNANTMFQVLGTKSTPGGKALVSIFLRKP